MVKSTKKLNMFDKNNDIDEYDNCVEFNLSCSIDEHAVKILKSDCKQLFILEHENKNCLCGEIYWSYSLDEILDIAQIQFDQDCKYYGNSDEKNNDIKKCLREDNVYMFTDVFITYILYSFDLETRSIHHVNQTTVKNY